jgi:hypothetical protein
MTDLIVCDGLSLCEGVATSTTTRNILKSHPSVHLVITNERTALRK